MRQAEGLGEEEGRRRQPQARGPRAGDSRSQQVRSGPRPSRARTKLRAAAEPRRRRSSPLGPRSPGPASRQAPTQTTTYPARTHPRPYPPLDASPWPRTHRSAPTRGAPTGARTHPRPHPPWPGTRRSAPTRGAPAGAHPPRPASTLAPRPRGPHLPGAPQSAQCAFPGRCSSSRKALRSSLAMAAMSPARDAGAGAGAGSVHPTALGSHAGRPPRPPPLRHPGRPQPAHRFRIPATRPAARRRRSCRRRGC